MKSAQNTSKTYKQYFIHATNEEKRPTLENQIATRRVVVRKRRGERRGGPEWKLLEESRVDREERSK